MKSNSGSTLVLSTEDIQKIINHFDINRIMDTLISRITSAIQSYDPSNTVIPIRSGFNYSQPYTGLIEWMPLYEKNDLVTIKVVGYHPSNPNVNKCPTILSTISAYDTASGHLIGIIDGVLLTALRTGAASAIASKYLARPESSVLGLIGCGAQAVTQLHALSRCFNFETVRIYDADVNTMLSFEERCAGLDIKASIVSSSVEEIVNTADILCTATSIDVGAGPLFENLTTKPHLHINAVGSDFPGKIELPIDFLENSFVCPDFIDQAVIEGECQQLSKEQIGADWIKVIQQPSDYQHVQKQRSVFDSTGWALEDRVAMELFMEYAHTLGLGQTIEIENISEDVKSPYFFLNKTVKA